MAGDLLHNINLFCGAMNYAISNTIIRLSLAMIPGSVFVPIKRTTYVDELDQMERLHRVAASGSRGSS